ncbi:putative ribonuclease H-like domain-containing protein [Tanacetum coccineum]
MALVKSPQMISIVKLPMLKKGEYTLWSMMMEQYLTNTDYGLWQVIMNGDEPVQTTKDENGVETEVPPKTAQALLQRQKEIKAKSIMLLAILDEYQLRFHIIKDAKSLWAVIKSRFCGNIESKKMQKNVLKHQFENFYVFDTEGLDKAYDRFQKLISQLEVHGTTVSNKDANQKFLRALPSSWKNIALIMRNKRGINEDNTANGVSTATGHSSQGQASSSSYTNDLMFSFFADQSSGPQLDDEDLEQLDQDNLEEIDIKWECKAPRNQWNKNGDTGYRSRDNTKRTVPVKTSDALVVQDNALILQDGLGYDWRYIAQDEPTEFAFMAYTSNSSGSDTEVQSCSKNHVKKYEKLQKQFDEQRQTLSKANLEIVAYKLGLESVEAQLVVHQKNEVMYEEKIAVLEFEVKDKDQLNENGSSGSELFNSVFDSRSSDEDDNQIIDRFKKDNEYHAVPPPLTGNYIPILADLSFAELDDYVYRPTTNKTSASVSQVKTSNTPPSNTSIEMPRVEYVRPSGVIIEDWVSDDEEDILQSEDSQTTVKPSFKKIEFTKARNETIKTDKQAVKPRMVTQSPKVDRKDWNGKMTQKLGLGFGFTKKAFSVCRSHNHLIKDCDFHEKRMPKEYVLRKGTGHKEVRTIWNNTQRINHPKKFVPTAVLTRSGRIPVSNAKQNVNTATPKNRVNISKSKINTFSKSHSPIRRPFYKPILLYTRVSKEKVNTVRINVVNTAGQTAIMTVKGNGVTAVKASAGCGNPQQALKYKGMFDSGCSRHMTGNKAFLTDYQDINGGFVAFCGNTRGGKITGIGKIRTNKIDFEDVFFVKELKFNIFFVSQMCDKKNNILFTETECLVLSPGFKLIDESQVLFRVPRQNNMYNFDLKNVVSSGDLTCLFTKATIDESKLWHRRLGHVNFKTMNKLVKGNLVRGFPSKAFENDHTCVACQKGKQHKASCKTKLVSSISQPLQMLHMDLFGQTSVRSINHKTYCLVVTDDFSRFSWVFFLATKSETSGILKKFITEIENKLNHKVKVIRSNNGTKFKNREMDEFCGQKGIKREYSVARTPQQNGVAERKNRTLIEAARTMLADSLLPTVFWAEAVNTACYVLNRVLVTKPHNKTPYELIIGRAPSISFMRPFGCPVTILNTLDPLGKFDGKAEEGFLVGYSVNSKAFRVFNTETRKVEENLHVNFLENKPNITGQGPNWLFDIDSLTNSMNYQPVSAGNQTNKNAEENESTQQYIVFPLWSSISSSYKSSDDKAKDYTVDDDACRKTTQEPASEYDQALKNILDKMMDQGKEAIRCFNTASTSRTFSPVGPSFVPFGGSFPIDAANLLHNPLMPKLEDTIEIQSTGIFCNAYDDYELEILNTPYADQSVGAEADFNNMEPSTIVSPIPTTRVHSIHPEVHIIGDPKSAVQTRGMTKKNSGEHAMISYIQKQRRTNHKDFQNCLFACFLSQHEPTKISQALDDESWVEAMQEELLQFKIQKVWTLVDLPSGKKAIGTKWVYRNKKDEMGIVVRNKAILVAHRYKQEECIDYDEVFALVARIEAIRIFLAFASFMNFPVYQDVKSDFLYGTIEEDVYVCQPPGFVDPEFPEKVYKVEKALYGLHQAPRAWYETLSCYLLDNGFHKGQIDKNLFIKRLKGDILLVQVYVDDIIFGSTKKSLCDEFEQIMHNRFQMSSMGELNLFLGLPVKQKEDGIFISQDKYVGEILKKFGFSSVRTASTPMETNKALTKDEDGEDVDVHLYRSMIGSLMYLTSSRLDIIYLKGQPKLGLWYPKDSPLTLEAFSDSDYAGASLDKKSTTGCCQFLGSRLISWQCKKHTVVANSTTEAEYIAASHCCGQVLWIQNQILDYGFNFMQTKIHVDNESAICVVKNPVSHSKTMHIEIRHHFIRDSYEKRLIEMVKIHTDNNVADLLTKAFDVSRFNFLVASIGRDTKIPQSGGPPIKVGDKAVHKEMSDRMERAATIAFSFETEQDNVKSEGSEGFHEIIDFLTSSHIYYALTECPTLYISLIEQFWQTAALSTTKDGVHTITATIDGRDKIITEASIRRHVKPPNWVAAE